MKIQVIHSRDPDSECGIEIFLDGKLADFEEEDIDPGRGYVWDDGWAERLLNARREAAENPASEYHQRVYSALLSNSWSKYVEGKPEDWFDRINDPAYDGDDDAYDSRARDNG